MNKFLLAAVILLTIGAGCIATSKSPQQTDKGVAATTTQFNNPEIGVSFVYPIEWGTLPAEVSYDKVYGKVVLIGRPTSTTEPWVNSYFNLQIFEHYPYPDNTQSICNGEMTSVPLHEYFGCETINGKMTLYSRADTDAFGELFHASHTATGSNFSYMVLSSPLNPQFELENWKEYVRLVFGSLEFNK